MMCKVLEEQQELLERVLVKVMEGQGEDGEEVDFSFELYH
jgi:hypothetical protein